MTTTQDGMTTGVSQSGVSTVEYLPKDERNRTFPPDRTILLVIDPVNDFLSEEGAGWEMVKTTST